MNRTAFDTFALNDSKYQLDLESYLPDGEIGDGAELGAQASSNFQVHICTWDYMHKGDADSLLSLKRGHQIRMFILKKLRKRVKGMPRVVYRELMYTVTKFCKRSRFSVEQTAAVLSQFYLTHSYFVGTAEVGAEKLYEFFKNLQLCHSLPFPPQFVKIFNLAETKDIMTYFCRVYLRNLPIIRLASLPNFTLEADFRIRPEKPLGKKGKKDKKGKRTKKKKK